MHNTAKSGASQNHINGVTEMQKWKSKKGQPLGSSLRARRTVLLSSTAQAWGWNAVRNMHYCKTPHPLRSGKCWHRQYSCQQGLWELHRACLRMIVVQTAQRHEGCAVPGWCRCVWGRIGVALFRGMWRELLQVSCVAE